MSISCGREFEKAGGVSRNGTAAPDFLEPVSRAIREGHFGSILARDLIFHPIMRPVMSREDNLIQESTP